MSMMKILWEKKALRQMQKFSMPVREVIIEAVKTLITWPDCRNVKSLVNHEYEYRLRVGRYRVFFDIEDALKILKIEEVKKRDESTY
jgi:mRNA-degrading endonuclease RelE of RelBE toxin-antitoxin system